MARPLPEGTITLLFTDIEGSTAHLHRLGDEYATLLADQRAILRAAFAKWNGHEVGTEGDPFFAVFARAGDAVAAAAEAQRAPGSGRSACCRPDSDDGESAEFALAGFPPTAP